MENGPSASAENSDKVASVKTMPVTAMSHIAGRTIVTAPPPSKARR
jgi:hypothetical protein